MLAAALRLRDDIGGALTSGSTLAGIDALLGRMGCRRRRFRAASRSSSAPTRCAPGWAPRSRRGRVRARPRSCSAPVTGPATLAHRVDARPAGARPLPRRSASPDPRPLRSPPLPRGDLPARSVGGVGEQPPRSTASTPGRSPTPTAASVRPRRGGSAPPTSRRPTSTRRPATRARPRRCSARWARSTAPGVVGGRRLRRRAHVGCDDRGRHGGAGRGRASSASSRPAAPRRTPRCCGHAASWCRRARRSRWPFPRAAPRSCAARSR